MTIVSFLLALALVVLTAFDIWSTRYILARGGKELNPIWAWVLGRFGLRGFYIVRALWSLIPAVIIWLAAAGALRLVAFLVLDLVVGYLLWRYNLRAVKQLEKST